MGLLAGAARLPTFLVSLAAGVIVDRLARKRRLMIWMDLLRAVLLLSVPAALLTGHLSLPVLYGVTFLVGAGSVFHELAQNAYIPSIVPADRLLGANAKLRVGYSVGESVGPGGGRPARTAGHRPVRRGSGRGQLRAVGRHARQGQDGGLPTALAIAGVGGALALTPLIGRPIWRLRRMPQDRLQAH